MTSISTLPTSDYQHLQTVVGLSQNSRIDRDRHIIFGVSILQKGDLNDDRPWMIDNVSIKQVVDLAKSTPKGLKSRFTHPNMSNDGLGKFIGRLRKPRVSQSGNDALADLHMAPIAFKSSIEGMQQSIGDYVLDLAENEPDVFGISLAPKLDEAAMGKLEKSGSRTPMRFLKHHAGDVVDQRAATRGGLFGGVDLSIGTAPRLASESLDKLFADADEIVIRQRVGSFLNTYLENRFQQTPEKTKEAEMPELTMKDVTDAIDTSNKSLLSGIDDTIAKAIQGALTDPESGKKEVPSDLSDQLLSQQKEAQGLTALAQLCGLSNSDELLTDWLGKLSAGFTVVDAKAQLGELAIKHNTLTDGDPTPDDGGLDRKLSAAYDEHTNLHKGLGFTKKEWIASAKKELLRQAEDAA